MRSITAVAIVLLLGLFACSSSESQNTDSTNQWEFEENTDAGPVDDSGEPIVCPGEDDDYYYASEDPEECALIDYQCDPEQEHFFDPDCGCGCVGPPANDECPTEEDGYEYVSEDPDECAMIFVACDDGEEVFDDPDCGCGCIVGDDPVDECSPQDAEGEGDCRAELGYAFNGRICTNISGCDCVGDDCDELADSQQECESAYEGCLDGACDAMDAAGDGGMCDGFYGYSYQGPYRGCVAVNGCGCEGDDCDILYDELSVCRADHQECAEPTRPDGPTCNAWDAAAQGPCDAELGYTYDGSACVSISGCTCTGTDCDRLTPELEGCQKQVRDCTGNCGDPDGAICDIYVSIDPANCPDGSAYTVMDCEPLCVDPDTCDPVQ